MAISTCPRLSEISGQDRVTVRSLSSPTEDIGQVSDSSVLDEGSSLNALFSSLVPDDYFLLYTYDGNYCAYRMNINKGTNFERPPGKDIDRDAYGTKTNFVLNGYTAGPVNLVVLNNGSVLAIDELDANKSWYSVGNKLAAHLHSISDYYDIIERYVWQTSLYYFIPELAQSVAAMAGAARFQEIESDEALVEIAAFMDWLSRYDPAIYEKTAFRIDQSTKEFGGLTYCEMQTLEDAYAYTSNGEIGILPAGILALKEGEYELMALVLEHELAHIKTDGAELIRPSEQLFTKVLLLYIGTNRIYNIPELEGYLIRHAPCQLQPLILEDELAATLAEILSPNAVTGYELAESYLLMDDLTSWMYDPNISPPPMIDVYNDFIENALK